MIMEAQRRQTWPKRPCFGFLKKNNPMPNSVVVLCIWENLAYQSDNDGD